MSGIATWPILTVVVRSNGKWKADWTTFILQSDLGGIFFFVKTMKTPYLNMGKSNSGISALVHFAIALFIFNMYVFMMSSP